MHMLEALPSRLLLLASLSLVPVLAAAQGGKGGKKGAEEAPKEGEEAAVALQLPPTPKAIDETIKKNVELAKKESVKLGEKLGGDFGVAFGTVLKVRAEGNSNERVQELVRAGDTMVEVLAEEFGVDKVKDLWAGSRGPFNMYYFKSKSTFGDALREVLEKEYPRHALNTDSKTLLDIGRFIRETPSPLTGGFFENEAHEYHLAHMLGQTFVFYLTRGGPPFKSAPATTGEGASEIEKIDPKVEMELMQQEDNSWLNEGAALYSSVRFCGANHTYCVTNAKYVGNIAIADKDVDTAYRLVCYEMAMGDEKSKDFKTLSRTETNSLDYLDLAKAWSFYDWMTQAEMRPKLVALLKGMRGRSFGTSLKQNLGWSFDDLEEKWKAFAKDEYGPKKKKKADDKSKGGKPAGPQKKDPKSK